MTLEYRKPGVYVEESLRVGTADVGATSSLALFVGASSSGPIGGQPTRIGSWSEYVNIYGGFAQVEKGGVATTTYLPYAVYAYFQNGGRPCYVARAVSSVPGNGGVAPYGYITTGQDEVWPTSAAVDDSVVMVEDGAAVDCVDGVVTVPISSDGKAHNMVPGAEFFISSSSPVTDELYVYPPNKGVKAVVTATTSSSFSYLAHPGAPDTTLSGDVTVTAFPERVLKVTSKLVGADADPLQVQITPVDETDGVFHLSVIRGTDVLEQFRYLAVDDSIAGVPSAMGRINDPYAGSAYITLSNTGTAINSTASPGSGTPSVSAAVANLTSLSLGENPDAPDENDLRATAQQAAGTIDQPLLINIPGYIDPSTGDYLSATPTASDFQERSNIFIINDNVGPRAVAPSDYANMVAGSTGLGVNTGDSRTAAYTPWVQMTNPANRGVIAVPPGGAVCGVISRTDAQHGVWRAPAGVIATVNGALSLDTKYSDADLGMLNARNINVIREVQGSSIAIMGARTRKMYGVDRYVNSRRTIIYLTETLRRSTEYALFENNDHRLWGQLRQTAENILRPLWEQRGLRGTSAAEAYYIKCDEELNTPTVVESGEVRMEVGVALETPAEFIVIRINQHERSGTNVAVIN